MVRIQSSRGGWGPTGTFTTRKVDIKIGPVWKSHILPWYQAGSPNEQLKLPWEAKPCNFHFILFWYITNVLAWCDIYTLQYSIVGIQMRHSKDFVKGLLGDWLQSLQVKLVYSYLITERNPNHYSLSPKFGSPQVWGNSLVLSRYM